jgi:hypothetical protein
MRSVITSIMNVLDNIGFRAVRPAAHMVLTAYVVVALVTVGMDSTTDQATTHTAQVQGGQQSTAHAPHDVQEPTLTPAEGRCLAAALIFARMESGLPMYEDLTWQGVPDVVGRYNDDLLEAHDTRAQGDTIDQWVTRYVGQCIASDWYEETGIDVQYDEAHATTWWRSPTAARRADVDDVRSPMVATGHAPVVAMADRPAAPLQ